MTLLLIMGGIIFIWFAHLIYRKYIAAAFNDLNKGIQFRTEYNKKLSILNSKILQTDLDEIESDIEKLKAEIQFQQQNVSKIKRHILNDEKNELEKYFSSNQISKMFLQNNGTIKGETETH